MDVYHAVVGALVTPTAGPYVGCHGKIIGHLAWDAQSVDYLVAVSLTMENGAQVTGKFSPRWLAELPDEKEEGAQSCGSCASFENVCSFLIQRKKTDKPCDWKPSRFRAIEKEKDSEKEAVITLRSVKGSDVWPDLATTLGMPEEQRTKLFEHNEYATLELHITKSGKIIDGRIVPLSELK